MKPSEAWLKKKKLPDLRDRLYSKSRPHSSGAFPDSARYRAEIQIRTLLQHAWAVFYHDRLYKSDFPVPAGLQREAIRLAASLEAVDEKFSGIIGAIESYRNYIGFYENREIRVQELARLKTVLRYDPDNMALAIEIAKKAETLKDWKTVADVPGRICLKNGEIQNPMRSL